MKLKAFKTPVIVGHAGILLVLASARAVAQPGPEAEPSTPETSAPAPTPPDQPAPAPPETGPTGGGVTIGQPQTVGQPQTIGQPQTVGSPRPIPSQETIAAVSGESAPEPGASSASTGRQQAAAFEGNIPDVPGIDLAETGGQWAPPPPSVSESPPPPQPMPPPEPPPSLPTPGFSQRSGTGSNVPTAGATPDAQQQAQAQTQAQAGQPAQGAQTDENGLPVQTPVLEPGGALAQGQQPVVLPPVTGGFGGSGDEGDEPATREQVEALQQELQSLRSQLATQGGRVSGEVEALSGRAEQLESWAATAQENTLEMAVDERIRSREERARVLQAALEEVDHAHTAVLGGALVVSAPLVEAMGDIRQAAEETRRAGTPEVADLLMAAEQKLSEIQVLMDQRNNERALLRLQDAGRNLGRAIRMLRSTEAAAR